MADLDLDQKRAKNLLEYKIDVLWEVRNIDFYGNVKVGTEMRELSRAEVEAGLNAVEKIIEEVEKVLNDDTTNKPFLKV